MKSAKIPSCEPARLEALRRYAALDTPREPVFDRITRLAASVFGVPIAWVSLLNRERQCFKSCVGMNHPGGVDRKIAFCAHTILSDEVMVVPDTWQDPRFLDNPLVTGAPSIRFYAGASLVTPDGFRVGTLCIADRVPRSFSPKQAAELQDFAALVIETLEARRTMAPLIAAVETTAFGVTICDPHQVGFPIIFANPGFAAITGYDREEILGQSCRFLQGDRTDPALVQDMRKALACRQPFCGTVRNYRKDGTPFWNSLNINPVLDDSGALISYVGVQVDITAQVEALEKTRQSEARLATAQRAASLGSWECHFTAEGVLDERSVLWSDETYRLVGLAPGTAVDLWDQFFRSLHPDDAPALNAAWSESLRTLQPYRIDHRLILPDGTERVVHEEAHFVFDEASGKPLRMVGIMQDITERKRIEESLRESEARFLHIASNVPGMVYRYVRRADGTTALPFASQGCHQLYGLPPEELQHDATKMLGVIHPEDRAALTLSVSASADNLSPWNWQGRVIKPDTGEIRYVQGMSRPERHANGDIVWDGLIVDVTDRKHAEEARRAQEVAERTNQEKSRFLSRMSHELRTPLNAILGFGQVLEFSKLQGQEATALRYILQGGQHLLSLVDEVLDLSRAETGDLHLILTEVNADAVARECVGLLARLAEARGITCSVEDPSRPVRLRCDEQRLRQTLLNLLSNAIKYNREGGRVFVRFQPASAGRLRLNVVDTGPGIAPEGLARLFVPFERLDYEHRGVEGTGLGLVVSRRVAEAMDGVVGVESEVGRGSTFYIELPLAPFQPEPAADPAPVGGPAGGDGPVREGVVVLYIEDNPSNLQVMEMLLARRRPHWRFLSARDGREGLDQAHREPPGLVLLDLQLPGMSGEEVLEKLRGDPATASVRVVVLSADATQHSRARLLAHGADEYVSKPFQVEALLQLLDHQLVQNKPGHRHPALVSRAPRRA